MSAFAVFTSRAAEADSRLFEMSAIYPAPGSTEALHRFLRERALPAWAKHEVEVLGFWEPIENPSSKLVCVLAYRDAATRKATTWAKAADPQRKEWKELEPLIAKAEHRLLHATDFSPPIDPIDVKQPRVFELRTYTTTPGNLGALHARFRDHTMALFAKHGMTNLFYWRLADGRSADDKTLIYFLAHASEEAAKASFAAFRTDADWIKVRTASEEKAGGSLTIPQPDGVRSEFFRATDYSPTK